MSGTRCRCCFIVMLALVAGTLTLLLTLYPLNSGLFMTTCIFLSCARFSSKTKILHEVFQHDGPYDWCLFHESYSCKQFKTFCIFEVYYVDVVCFIKTSRCEYNTMLLIIDTCPLVSVSERPCIRNPCKNGGKCYRVSVNYRCVCQPGYSGIVCGNIGG